MRILLCHNYYQQSGGEFHVFEDESRLLASRGHEVIRFTRHNNEIRNMRSWRVAVQTVWNSQAYADLRDLIRRERPDVVHMTNTFPLISPAAHYAARAENVPVVQSLHNYRLLCPRADFLRDGRTCEDCVGKTFPWPALLHRCYRGSRAATAVTAAMVSCHRTMGTWTRVVDRFVAPTEFARNRFIAGGLPPDKIVVKPNFLRRDPGVGTGDGGFVVFVGRLAPEKGVATLLAAWERLPGDLRLKVIGDGPLADRVRTAAAQDRRIEWLGELPVDRVLPVVGDAACLVVPSICYETFGRTAVEAFAKGTPVIASRLGAMQDVLTDGVTGLHFRPGDPEDLAGRIRRFFGEPAKMAAMGRAARREYETAYTAERNYDLLMQIYQQALACRRKANRGLVALPVDTPSMQPAEKTAPSGEPVGREFAWPASLDLFDIPVTPTDYEEAATVVLEAARRRVPGVVSCHAVHAIVTASRDDALGEMVRSFEMITPDGQPVRWALNLLHAAGLRDRVYGPDLMLELCRRAAEQGVSIYLYGGGPGVVEQLQANLRAKYPPLKIAGYESPPFRPLTAEEDRQVVERIDSSGAGLVFIGLGCPKQDVFAFEHRDRINAVQICVGAAFDFHAGMKPSAPGWMQQRGLEWLFRLWQEPGRLWKRYLITNTLFMWMLIRAWLAPRRAPAQQSSWIAAGLRPFRELAAMAIRIVRRIARHFRAGGSS